MSRLTGDEVSELFNAETIVATPAPKYAVGGGTFDPNDKPGYGHEDPLVQGMMDAPYKSDASVPPLEEGVMVGGSRLRRKRSVRKRSGRKQNGGQRSRSSSKNPRFQLNLKATVRLRSRQQK